jgi:hypothetical protein
VQGHAGLGDEHWVTTGVRQDAAWTRNGWHRKTSPARLVTSAVGRAALASAAIGDLPAGTTARVTSVAGLGAITTPHGDTGGPLRHNQIQIGPGNPQIILTAGVQIGSVTIHTPGPAEPLNTGQTQH